MEITEVRVAVCEAVPRPGPGGGRGEPRLKAYVTLTFDGCFVVRNIKIIEGTRGLFVAMPSRKPKASCPRCSYKGDAGARYCTQCGASQAQPPGGAADADGGDAGAHRDIAHPITAAFRQYLQRKVLDAYEAERQRLLGAGAAAGVASDRGGE
jgi:stage V sporulation protein G